MENNATVVIKKVYPKFVVAKGLAIAGIGYVCYKTGKFIQKCIDSYDLRHGTVTFDKKEDESK